ncbi:MAG: hypothetical protein RL885_12145 [Planctomycetota bacterium]
MKRWARISVVIVATVMIAGAALWMFGALEDVRGWLSGVRVTGPVDTREEAESSPSLSGRSSAPVLPAAKATSEVVVVPQHRGDGTIRLHFRDTETGDSIADLPFVVFAERNGLRLLGRGRSDRNGRAIVKRLPADAILVETDRMPPWATSLAAIWLRAGRDEEHVVDVGRGGVVKGRIVDDRGLPIGGARVLHQGGAGPSGLSAQLENEATLSAETDTDGRFEIDALMSRSRGVWIVDGRPRPERFEDVRLQFEADGHYPSSTSAAVADGRSVDLGDVVLPRLPRYEGRVVDGSGQPLAGVLITGDPRRAADLIPMGSVVRTLTLQLDASDSRPGEVLTDLEGQFELEPTPIRQVRAVTSSGQVVSAQLPSVGPGEVGRLEIRIEEERLLLLEPVGVDGERVVLQNGSPRLTRLWVTILLSESSSASFEGAPRDDGLVPISLREPVESEASGLIVSALGYRRVHIDLPSGLPMDGVPLRVTLEPKALLRLRLDRESDTGGFGLQIRACLVAKITDGSACCGLGASRRIGPVDATQTIELRVTVDEPYWIHVRRDQVIRKNGQLELDSHTESFGPFRPGSEVHSILLTGELVKPNEKLEAPRDEPTEPPPEKEVEPDGMLRLAILDQDGTPLPAETRLTSATDERQSLFGFVDARPGTRPGERIISAPPGPYALRILAEGYRPIGPIDVVLLPGEELDLGDQILERLPVWRGRLVGLSEDQLQSLRLTLIGEPDEYGSNRQDLPLDSKGELRIESQELEDPVRLELRSRNAIPFFGPAGRNGSSLVMWPQTIVVPRWEPEEVREIPVARWQPVALRVSGIQPEHQETDFPIHIEKLDASESESGTWRNSPPPNAAGERIYSLLLPPGQYRVSGVGLLYHFNPVDIVIQDGVPAEPVFVQAVR